MTTLLEYSLPLEKQKLENQINPDERYKIKLFCFHNYYVEIQENPYDCGCLILGFVEDIDKNFQIKLEEFMHQNGYSKILFTVAVNAAQELKRWTNLGYIAIDTGRSPRHPEKILYTYLLYKVIDPKFKGYV